MARGPSLEAARTATAEAKNFTGNRGLEGEEGLIFEIGRSENSGVDLEEPPSFADRLGGLERRTPLRLPGLSEPEAMRHFVRLSRQNYAIDLGIYPLGSCTMKHNPRLNEAMARLPGFADIHPLQPQSSVPGALELIASLARWLAILTGMDAVTMTPRAGAHGEICGLMMIKAAIAARGEAQRRRIILVPESAHGTNPASAAGVDFEVRPVPVGPDGVLDPDAVKKRLGPDVAALMLTNPNTCGLFEKHIAEIADLVHAAGAYFYCDGANFNAILGKVRPGDLGVDAMHINLHKTFSTPHGGGGPGAGPVVLSGRLAPFAPVPFLRREKDQWRLVENLGETHNAFGRIAAFHGQFGLFVRAYVYMLSHGGDGLRQVAEDAVLNANYVRAGLKDLMSEPYGDRFCMHEVLFDESWLKPFGLSALDFAKAMIDEGFHPMTVYFPLVVHGAMLIEPTETESKASLDLFIAALRDLAQAARRGETERFKAAPKWAPRRRLDETRAARNPVLKWVSPAGLKSP
ncbi:MAG: aminomethyl-transferring glycine dehydrogenase subunit GcvPB [Alphaproteobacteria bacterium]|nr:aminomethyl-transferring glycine dehydrogenase subunit GcvPB [Alphaproteobacteria bacterium]